MAKDLEERFSRWWKREREAGVGVVDDLDLRIVEIYARAAYIAGARAARRKP